jgi:hypothetical protein
MKKEENVSASDMELLMRTRDRSPILFNRVMELLQIVNEPVTRKADDVEFSVIDNLRQMGKDALSCWAEERSEYETEKMLKQDSELKRAGKKKSTGKQPMER